MDSNETVKIESIDVRLGDITAKLTLNQAKNLQKALNDMLGTPERTVYRDRWYPSRPWGWYYEPLTVTTWGNSCDAVGLSFNTVNADAVTLTTTASNNTDLATAEPLQISVT